MPFAPASSLEKTIHLKALLMGTPGIGKTTVSVMTTPRPVGVILCEGDTALNYALVAMREEGLSSKEIDENLRVMRADKYETMLQSIADARAAAESGEIKTLVVDPLTFFADRLTDQAFIWTKTHDGKEDGRRAHPEATKRLRQLVYQLLGLPCHVVVVTHYMDVGDAAKKGGPDKVPMLPNKEMRAVVHGMFPHKLWMEMRDGKRVFVMTPEGFTGPGVRGYRGAETMDADMGALMRSLSIPFDDDDVPPPPKKAAPSSPAKAPAPAAARANPVPRTTTQPTVNNHTNNKPQLRPQPQQTRR